LFSIGAITDEKCLRVLLFAVASSCLVAHVFVLNDWSGMSTDLRDPYRAGRVFTTRGLGRREVGYLAASLLILSLLLLAPLGLPTVCIAGAIAVLSAFYSIVQMKGVALICSAVHLAGGLLHFLLGYSLFAAVDRHALEIGSFFALTFTAGHLTHEARDWRSDLVNRITTNAVTFGKAGSFAAGFIVFTAADALLVALALTGVVPRSLSLVAALYPLHAWWTWQAFRAGLTFESIRRLQIRYRVLYAVIGLLMIGVVLTGNPLHLTPRVRSSNHQNSARIALAGAPLAGENYLQMQPARLSSSETGR